MLCRLLNRQYRLYAGIYALPQVLPSLELGVSTAMNLLLACLIELFGYGLALMVGTHVSRVNAMVTRGWM